MSRVARKSYESCYFHVIVQGYEKEYIFQEDDLKEYFLHLLLEEVNRFEIELLEYCIMGNHAHILLYCDKIEQMSLYMKSVNTKYAMFYNAKMNRVGYVFRDRFLSKPIQEERYLYDCIPYIHMNPVEAGIVDMPGKYKYSSYNDFINKTGIVTDSVLVKLFGSKDNYMGLFHFLHMGVGEGFEFKTDEKRLTFVQSKKVINTILDRYCLNDLKNETKETQKFFYNKFIKKRVPIKHIEKILGIDHRRIKRILNDELWNVPRLLRPRWHSGYLWYFLLPRAE